MDAGGLDPLVRTRRRRCRFDDPRPSRRSSRLEKMTDQQAGQPGATHARRGGREQSSVRSCAEEAAVAVVFLRPAAAYASRPVSPPAMHRCPVTAVAVDRSVRVRGPGPRARPYVAIAACLSPSPPRGGVAGQFRRVAAVRRASAGTRGLPPPRAAAAVTVASPRPGRPQSYARLTCDFPPSGRHGWTTYGRRSHTISSGSVSRRAVSVGVCTRYRAQVTARCLNRPCTYGSGTAELPPLLFRSSLPSLFFRITQYMGDTHNTRTLIPMNTRANPTLMSIFEDCAGRSSRSTKSP
jgi:hypothetical protein